MAKCSSCGKEIANNTMLQVGNGSFCNEECSQKFDKMAREILPDLQRVSD